MSAKGARTDKEPVVRKPAELRYLTNEQLEVMLREVQANLFQLRLLSETERLENPKEIVKAKLAIARIMKILREREAEREREPSPHQTHTSG